MRGMIAEKGLKWLFQVLWSLNTQNNVQTNRVVLLDETCCLLRRAIKGSLKQHMAVLKAV